MSKIPLKANRLWALAIGVGLVIVALENALPAANNGSLLLTLTFWIAIAQGSVALVAAAELSNARWVSTIRKELLSVYPLQLFLTILFIFLFFKIYIYPWHSHPNAWLNKWFFGIRNLALLLITFLVARKFTFEVLKESARKNVWAALYVLAFVISQSLVAFDWIMSLEPPWISTLFGGYFFIEAFYSGIALSAIIGFFMVNGHKDKKPKELSKTLKDLATLTFGFSLLWAGQLFAQYLVIWYGNIPEEVSYLAHRLTVSPTRELSYFVLVSLFILPFVILLSRWVKDRPVLVALVALVILAGIACERIVFILPVLPLQTGVIVLEFLLIGFLLTLLIAQRKTLYITSINSGG